MIKTTDPKLYSISNHTHFHIIAIETWRKLGEKAMKLNKEPTYIGSVYGIILSYVFVRFISLIFLGNQMMD